MTPQQFVSNIRSEVLEQNWATYQSVLSEESLSGSVSQYWPQMAKFSLSLNQEQRKQFEMAIRQVMVDTISNILGILDGTSILEHYRGDFNLTYNDDKKQLNGDLQTFFLAAEQEKKQSII
jgi:hypothetical protein